MSVGYRQGICKDKIERNKISSKKHRGEAMVEHKYLTIRSLQIPSAFSAKVMEFLNQSLQK
jgi:hypothetical protein